MTKDDELHRIRITDETYAALKEGSVATGHSYDTLIQLWNAAAGDDPAAVEAARFTLTHLAATQAELRKVLVEQVPNMRIAAIRLKKWHPDPSTAADGFTRTHAGADFTTCGADLWRSTRGFWVIGTNSNATATYRLGHFLGLHSGVTWSGTNPAGRRHALTGYLVKDGKRIDPESGMVLGPCSDEEDTAFQILSGRSLAMPSGAANPVANLF